MKFANYISNSRNANNIGDSIIALALDDVYRQMGVEETDVVRISIADLPRYSGEHIILPIVRTLADYPEISKAFSKDITPVFINLVLYGSLQKSDVDYLKHYEPIGCRDVYTISELRSHGIAAYLNGCITACFPRMTSLTPADTTGRKVFLVDIQPELEAFIPDEIKQGAIRLSHIFPGNLPNDPIYNAKCIYEMYKQEARLVVTSRLHAASPCMAAGIPVILAKNEFSHRFAWIDRLMPVYDLMQYSQINWNPIPVEYEEHKSRILRLAMARINGATNISAMCSEIGSFYEQREKRAFVTPLSKTVSFIDAYFDKAGAINYSLWGITSIALSIYQYISHHFPNAKLMHVFDKFRRMEFCGHQSEPIEAISQQKNEFLVACPLTEAIDAQMREYLDKSGKDPETYIIAHWSP